MKKCMLTLLCAGLNVSLLFSQVITSDYKTNIFRVNKSEINSVLIQTDGKIISGGWTVHENITELLLMRHNPDGMLDIDFGFDGLVLTGYDGQDIEGHSIGLQTDGKILMAGTMKFWDKSFDGYNLILTRYLADGSLDPAFGIDGRVMVYPESSEIYGDPSIDLLENGKILTSVAMNNLLDMGFVLFRFNTDGSLDSTFGVNGKVKTDFGSVRGSARAIQHQADGKIVVTGSSSTVGITVRYEANGALDNSFGNNGIILDEGYLWSTLQIQSDGRIVVAGDAPDASWWSNFALARYLVDGSLDNGFGSGGRVMTGMEENNLSGNSVVIQQNGQITLAGTNSYGTVTGNDNYDVVIARYNTNGSLDNSFGNSGIAVIDAGSAADVANSVVIGTDDKLILGGYLRAGFELHHNMLMRTNSDGEIDSTFNINGISSIVKNTLDKGCSISMVDDSMLVVAGVADSTMSMVKYYVEGGLDYSFGQNGIVRTKIEAVPRSVVSQSDSKLIITCDSLLCRFDENGSTDISFGNSGIVSLDSVASVQSIVQQDGKIVVAGTTTLPDNRFAVMRFNSNGAPDNMFGTGGMTITGFGNQGDNAYACAIQQDGKIILAGDTKISETDFSSVDLDFALARFHADGTLDSTFGINGRVTTALSSFSDHCNSVAIQADGKILCTGRSDSSFVLIRYTSEGEVDLAFGLNGIFITSDTAQYGNKVFMQPEENMIMTLVDSIKLVRFDLNGMIDATFLSGPLLQNPEEGEGLFDAIAMPDDGIALAGAFDDDFFLIRIPPGGFTSVEEIRGHEAGLSVFPNPARDHFNVSYEIQEPGPVTIRLYDMKGRIVKQFFWDEYQLPGLHNEIFSLDAQLSRGIYFLQLTTPFSSQGVKIMKQ